MSSQNVTLKVESELYEAFRSYCKRNKLVVSRQFELMMEDKVGSNYKKQISKIKKTSGKGTLKYVGSLTGEPFMLHENKIVASLLLDEETIDKIKNSVVQDNLFGYRTVKSVPKRVNSILKRIGNLDPVLLKKIAHDLSGDGRIVVLYSIYLRDRLFQEFMNEVMVEKFSIRDFVFEKRMITKFISDKSDSEKKLQEFTKETKLKLVNVIFNILKEAGLLISSDKSFRINNMFISSELRNYYDSKGESKFLKSLGALQ